ncbi:TetR/AcrR family transcriptional regulator [Gordonia humi]|uniref:AcrR family transcriptional regulator n=1 Tax=Gordonia humi TaxID=686429 RepID=A0A840ERJ2_9ACTN|nr:TetR family transcriptional regulator [Gordonia humi]MBB4134161.1 AcrR family transcriptional regulator [Gordonia humi]
MVPEANSNSRRDLIAESAIRIIARDGVRTLTHRAVDAEAGIPSGSTSYHARTRSALLGIVVDALADRTVDDALLIAVPDAMSIDDAADAICGLVRALAARRDDMRARYALVLELDDSDLRQRLTDRGPVHDVSTTVARRLLRSAGLAATDADVETVIELTDALVLQWTIADRESPWMRRIVVGHLRGAGVGDG